MSDASEGVTPGQGNKSKNEARPNPAMQPTPYSRGRFCRWEMKRRGG